MDTINIWYATGENPELSNLTLRPFIYCGMQYCSVEHAYQTLKSGEFDAFIYDNPVWKKSGTKLRGNKKPKIAYSYNLWLMEELIDTSFRQNEWAMHQLLNTITSGGEGDILTHTQDSGIWKTEFPRMLTYLRKKYLVEFNERYNI